MANQSNADLFSRPQLQLDVVESINALLRVAQAQQQQKCFVPSSQINDTVYTAPSEGNCSIAVSPNSTLESTQHSMVNVDSCHDYSYKNTAKEQEQLSDTELFLEEVQKYPYLWDVTWPLCKE